ncbi:MAG TPA: universal stress protein, partial [Methylocella sp.]|nr:universal stress protein [Methylocella sp.]
AAGLAAHLARHCTKATVARIPLEHGSIAGTLRAYAKKGEADLLVMGGYAHPRMLELVLGGVTSDMLTEAELPLLLSH